MTIPQKLYLTSDIKKCEQYAIETLHISADELMERAGFASFNLLQTKYPAVKNIAVFCGGGNNAGDGYVLARLAHEAGLNVIVYHTKAIEQLPQIAKNAALKAIALDIECQYLEQTIDSEIELIVDALLGIGLDDEVRDPIAHNMRVINDSDLPVISLDLPSGLEADTGCVLGTCVKASYTITFIAPKVGLYTLNGPDFSGKIVVAELGIIDSSRNILNNRTAIAQLLDENINLSLPKRLRNSHKGMFGHILIVGGGYGMPGAVHLSAMAAMRAGAGVVTIATRPEYACGVYDLPEALIYPIKNEHDLLALIPKATVIIIGPGLGEDEWALKVFNAVISAQLPLVIDAQALRFLAKYPQHDINWVLTPHPGEAADLLDMTVRDIETNRLEAALDIQEKYGGTVVLKGVGTIINYGVSNSSYICTKGNPGMSTAGMGDVLSGIIGALIAQNMLIHEAAILGVLIHAMAADDATLIRGERGLIASDLMPYIQKLVNDL